MKLEPAPLGARIGAALADLLVQLAIASAFVLSAGESSSGDGQASVSITGVPFLLMLVAILGYFFVLENQFGQTLGKRAFGLVVVGQDGERVGARRIAVRTLLRLFDGLGLYLVALIVIAVNPKRQRVGDMAARTMVVRGAFVDD